MIWNAEGFSSYRSKRSKNVQRNKSVTLRQWQNYRRNRRLNRDGRPDRPKWYLPLFHGNTFILIYCVFLFLYIFLDDWMSKIIVDIQIYSHMIPSVRTLAMPKEIFNTSCLFNNFGYNKLDIKFNVSFVTVLRECILFVWIEKHKLLQ